MALSNQRTGFQKEKKLSFDFKFHQRILHPNEMSHNIEKGRDNPTLSAPSLSDKKITLKENRFSWCKNTL